ncbi:hypothetical protein FISHEDRAFT_77461 [Fistulina hepatica ATCC 64428]|uniref:Uncharacterized protein n=1 Tax=Fistulina hepatica ATCC 64428 TaxID=1128425 RepID=A0A0D7A0H4_9AGAR|nr:hypothetical protein FISHEDRAFT_77461 [Fistulina hepatica ATCC 64428]
MSLTVQYQYVVVSRSSCQRVVPSHDASNTHQRALQDIDDSDDESNDSNTQSTCPTCRASFSIVNPELTYLPKKYHRYVLSSVRRLYLDTSKQEKWQEDIQELEQMNSRLRKKIERLRCENSLLASERDITIEAYNGQIESNSQQRHAVDKLKRELVCVKTDLGGAKEAQNELEAIKKDYRYLEKKYDKLKDHVRHLESSEADDFLQSLTETEAGPTSKKRKTNRSDPEPDSLGHTPANETQEPLTADAEPEA